jgi:hypothetical protein
MVVKNRADLMKLFANNTVPDAKSFELLFNSVLVKRDDKIFGKWETGIGYAEGDVVLHNHTLYYFTKTDKKADGTPCSCDDCGNEPPSSDSCCWHEIRVNTNDFDWEYTRVGNKTTALFAPDTTEIGIGTGKTAQAFFHIKDDKRHGGELLFNPKAVAAEHFPMLKMVLHTSPLETEAAATTPAPQSVSQRIDAEKVIFDTNTEGYLFQQNQDTNAPAQARSLQPSADLLFIGSENGQARVGIGTDCPDATLDMRTKDGRISANAGETGTPCLSLNTEGDGTGTYLTETIHPKAAQFDTNAKEGFDFKAKNKSLLVIQPHPEAGVNMGIGTSDPATELEVEGNEGKVQVSLNDHNPSVNIINKLSRLNRRVVESNYLSVGVLGAPADEQAAFSTNSKGGFVFQYDQRTEAQTASINEGNKFLCLKSDDAPDGLFSMLMKGRIASHGFYAATVPSNLQSAKRMPSADALQLIRQLKPMVFALPNDSTEEKQFGFRAYEIPNELESLVKNFDGLDSDVKGLAYHSLVALLVGAVKDLSKRVEELEKKTAS